jgi:hypothetical protein
MFAMVVVVVVLLSCIMDPSFLLFYLSSFQSGAIDGVV